MRKHCRQLDVSVETSEPRGFAVHLACARQSHARRPSHPALHVRDDRERPSCEAERRGLVEMICPTGKAQYFFDEDWTGGIKLKCNNKFDFARKRLKSGIADPTRCRTSAAASRYGDLPTDFPPRYCTALRPPRKNGTTNSAITGRCNTMPASTISPTSAPPSRLRENSSVSAKIVNGRNSTIDVTRPGL